MRIDHIGPSADTASLGLGHDQSYSGKALCVALSADGTRAYLGGQSGVWRSDDGGANWLHPEWPEPAPNTFTVPGGLASIYVFDIAISPLSNDTVFAGTGNDVQRPDPSGIYRSLDGAQTWALQHRFIDPSNGAVFPVGHFAIAADDPQLMFAAGGVALARSTDGGNTWAEVLRVPVASGQRIWHVAIGPLSGTTRRVYGCGSAIWDSRDGGTNWAQHSVPLQLGGPSFGVSAGPHALAAHPTTPNTVYLCASDQLWRGKFPRSRPLPIVWTQLPSVPIIHNGPTASGVSFVLPRKTPDGRVVFIASDRRTTCIARREPVTEADWVRVDSLVHVDPHGIAFTYDFQPQFPGGPAGGGRALLVNDGGAWVSTDGTSHWVQAKGLSTLNVCNVAVAGQPGRAPLVTFGGGDNWGFASADGGQHWKTQDYLGGDNDCSFSDPRQPTHVFVFAPRSKAVNGINGEIYHYVSPNDGPPDVALGTSTRRRILGPEPLPASPNKAAWSAVSNFWNVGYRPLVMTAVNEQPRPGGDLIVIRYTTTAALLLRTTAPSLIASAVDWATGATDESAGAASFQVGPALPVATISAAQASGGHAAPVFYVADPLDFSRDFPAPGTHGLWKWAAGMAAWQRLVPVAGNTAGPTLCMRFFVDPYRPNLLYVQGADHVFRSDTGGASWVVDAALERQLTAGGAYAFNAANDTNTDNALLRDMQFDAHRPGLRFAVGNAGVFMTLDGATWRTLLTSVAHGVRATSAVYDDQSCERALYVGTNNRGLLRLSPIPPDWDFPVGSLQVAVGHVTLLRVHEQGTGFGPPHDFLDAEVVVLLDTQPEKAFGFQLRTDSQRAAAQGRLDVLQDVFERGASVRLEFFRAGCRTAHIVRVIAQS